MTHEHFLRQFKVKVLNTTSNRVTVLTDKGDRLYYDKVDFEVQFHPIARRSA